MTRFRNDHSNLAKGLHGVRFSGGVGISAAPCSLSSIIRSTLPLKNRQAFPSSTSACDLENVDLGRKQTPYITFDPGDQTSSIGASGSVTQTCKRQLLASTWLGTESSRTNVRLDAVKWTADV
jgi:hypothetical protein